MKRWAVRVSRVLLAVAALGLGRPARARAERANETSVTVEVVDVAGGKAYVTPGEAAGLRVGRTARFGAQSFTILAINATYGVLDLKGQSLKRGTQGSTRGAADDKKHAGRPARPRELALFVGQWPRATRPALSQHPVPVPLGAPMQSGPTHALLGVSTLHGVPLSERGSPWLRGELRAQLRSEPFRTLPLQLDADAAWQLWAAGGQGYAASSAARPPLRVRALQLAYGRASDWFAAAGRLRYAARTGGMLDGIKARAPLFAGLSLSAFGGFIPDPLSGKPSSDAARFGAELAWEELTLPLRPRLALSAQASRFEGSLDERQLHATLDVFPASGHAGAYAALSRFDRDNPWRASTIELSAAGASVETHVGGLEWSARFDMQRPERSRWLAAFLPPGWFCTRSASASRAAEDTCRAGDARYLAQGDIRWRSSSLAVGIGATASRTAHVASEQLAGFANVSWLRLLSTLHVTASALAQTGSLMQSAAVNLDAGLFVANEQLELSVHYRPALTRYTIDATPFVEHSLGGSVLCLLGSSLQLSLAADVIAGRDLHMFLLQSLIQWRPATGS